MQKVIKNICLGISALISIVICSKIVGRPPQGVEQMILYSFPGGIVMVLVFEPLLKMVGMGQKARQQQD